MEDEGDVTTSSDDGSVAGSFVGSPSGCGIDDEDGIVSEVVV